MNIILCDCYFMDNGEKHDDVIKWKHFPRHWPFMREIHRSPVNFPHKGQWRGALMFSLIYAWINDWVNNREAGDLRRQHGHYDVIVMTCDKIALKTTEDRYGHYHINVPSYYYSDFCHKNIYLSVISICPEGRPLNWTGPLFTKW